MTRISPSPDMPHAEIIDLEAEEDHWEENRKTIKDTYRRVWHQFYDWEPGFAAATIASLKARTPSLDIPLTHWEPSSSLGDDDDSDSDDEEFDFLVLDFENRGTKSTVECKGVDIQSTVKPHPKYESVAPSSCNMYVHHDHRVVRFIKYGGEPGFDELAYIGSFPEDSHFEWQNPMTFYDPDGNEILYETMKHLIASLFGKDDGGHDIPLSKAIEEIDEYHILPPLTEASLQYTSKDLLSWPGSDSTNATRIEYTSSPTNVISRVVAMRWCFCSFLPCIQAKCMLHADLQHGDWEYVSPKITSEEMKSTERRRRCSNECYVSILDNEKGDIALEKNQEIEDILKMLPDALPCDLAIICRRPCSEMFRYRSLLFSDEKIKLERSRESKIHRNGYLSKYKDRADDLDKEWTAGTYALPSPCRHTGPCDAALDCECFDKKVHCQRECECDESCGLRYKGCRNCKRQCKDDCECVVNGLECSPEKCGFRYIAKSLNIKDQHIHNCQNQRMQIKVPVNCEVKEGTYGLGLFATTNIKQHEYIGSYVADIYNINDHTRDPLQKYNGLNYNFSLNPAYHLDSVLVGNNIRYVNHSIVENLKAAIYVVNAEHVIIFTAARNIKKGEELFWDYGPYYFES